MGTLLLGVAVVVVVAANPAVPDEDSRKLPWEDVVTSEEPSSPPVAEEAVKSWDVLSGDSTAKGSSIIQSSRREILDPEVDF